MQDQWTQLKWRDGMVPISVQFDDPYFSLDNGLAETKHVFLDGNFLPARFQDGFHVAELGFGTGLNFLTTWQAWREADIFGKLYFSSFEAYPMSSTDMNIALQSFPTLKNFTKKLMNAQISGSVVFDFGDVELKLIHGDARITLPIWTEKADAWFLDGFSPVKNPELWGVDLMRQVAAHTKPKGTAATYTAAGFVRRGLEDAGFIVERVPGYGRKRHMTRAFLG
ncbi:MAG: tRNA (5-methylaminomethyl-2-thiouridine)(34)-methyltransferase MnmD [Tateyamaria sp.]|jgi:tRNA U34 5-methylaminomethyl-2-thiouridine-forming methyltransferase MnmC|nr:tRNA (5-methylaminomethyl-2-thiouridine)(34)-methyltransferase MnmD [Tateyamaria sp.]MBT5302372.1 tRNA (5-methylaminomethyl-2-thiouridine)(34)-methyltransferase MnmD [Tateyamaria sp.]MBT6267425.1 tRNA (5-methylaminomethyl-2-thiouridine)(34)-methyltransferase MnmD [Tateyamaria sp.]MBT7800198.1 tRNA (5-methylaminomethyl-2-thiouridine)(34)-methyltransferase MnmD [Tateyamaria sp.]